MLDQAQDLPAGRVARSITNPDRQAQALTALAKALTALAKAVAAAGDHDRAAAVNWG